MQSVNFLQCTYTPSCLGMPLDSSEDCMIRRRCRAGCVLHGLSQTPSDHPAMLCHRLLALAEAGLRDHWTLGHPCP